LRPEELVEELRAAATRLLSLDPAKARCGWALFQGGVYARGGVWRGSLNGLTWDVPRSRTVVVEVPQVYAAASMSSDPNDLVDITFSGGFVARAAGPSVVRLMRPREWKGQVPKDITRERAKRRLTDRELEAAMADEMRIKPARFRADFWDALGVGLVALGRAKVGVVAP
jgi:hypothetical protein